MPDFAADVAPFEPLPAWRGVVRESKMGSIPHCRAVSAPLEWHPALLERLARLTLEVGPDAPSPVETGHPDLLVAGEVNKAPDIAACRTLGQELALKPVSAPRRLGVVMAADRLLLPAANSLLKLAEEPPSHACILFLLEGDGLLPTLRSRARFTALSVPLEVEAVPPPEKDAEWVAWIEGAKTKDALTVASELGGWAAWALSRGDFPQADRLEQLRLLAGTKNLSVSMLCDLLILALREELPFEHLFGDIR
ncbi:MAG: hypothetical protein K6E38_03430 [Fretibacterium sp.]|nr:hypothetical protein [Fretibacterium sp.]